MRLRRRGALREFLQKLLKSRGHSLGVVQLSEDESLLLQRRFPFARLWKAREQLLQIAPGALILFGFLVGERALGQGGWNLRSAGKRLEKISEGIDRLRPVASFAHSTSRV